VLGFGSQCYTKRLVPLAVVSLSLKSLVSSSMDPILKTVLEEEFINSPYNVSLTEILSIFMFMIIHCSFFSNPLP
jgi:hypothetical protein